MKALTLWQPWASFMAMDLKKNETRSWGTNYRGPLAIAAAAKKPDYRDTPPIVWALALEKLGPADTWPRGKILCIRDLIACIRNPPIPDDPIEAMLGFYGLARVAWKTKLLKVFEHPIPAKGHQGLWNFEIEDA